MKSRKSKLVIVSLLAASMLALTCCGAKKGAVGDTAASRGADEVSTVVYIDENAIALAASATAAPAGTAAQDAFNLINQSRQAAGLPALAWNAGLEQASRVRAQECQSLFSHTRPDGSDWWTVNSDLMYGENLAMDYYSANDAVQGWLASPTHYANIMADFTTGAIAIHQAGDGTWYWANEFGY